MNEYQGSDSQQLPRLLVCVACGNPVRLGYFQPGPWSRLDSACVRVKRLPPKLRLSPTPNHERPHQGPGGYCTVKCPPPTAPVDEPFPRTILLPGAAPDGTVKVSAALPLMLPYKSASTAPR